VSRVPPMVWREARTAAASDPDRAGELAIIACNAGAAALGAITGTLLGPGRAPDHVA